MFRFFQMFVDVCERGGAASFALAFLEGAHDEANAANRRYRSSEPMSISVMPLPA
jgi:hypothetical protein